MAFSMDDVARLSGAASAMGSPSAGKGQAADAGGVSDFAKTLEEIREKGLQAYAEEQQAKKLEELRSKILQSMGLTEDSLAAQTPERRDAIEKMVNTEVAKRLAAESQLNNDKNDDPASILARSGPNGLGTGAAMLQAMEAMQDYN